MSSMAFNGSVTRLMPAPMAFAVAILVLGCNPAPQVNETAADVEPSAAMAGETPLSEQVNEPVVADADFSFDGYSLPIPCRRTSDARELTPGGSLRNVIVFACQSHDVASAVSAMRVHMQAHGRTISDKEVDGDAKVIVATMPGTANTTIRVSKLGDSDTRTGSRVRLQWFSKD